MRQISTCGQVYRLRSIIKVKKIHRLLNINFCLVGYRALILATGASMEIAVSSLADSSDFSFAKPSSIDSTLEANTSGSETCRFGIPAWCES